jgi:hypothetical protein
MNNREEVMSNIKVLDSGLYVRLEDFESAYTRFFEDTNPSSYSEKEYADARTGRVLIVITYD